MYATLSQLQSGIVWHEDRFAAGGEQELQMLMRTAFTLTQAAGDHMLCAYFDVRSSFFSTELIALADDFFQLAPELSIHIFHTSYLQQSCLQPCTARL